MFGKRYEDDLRVIFDQWLKLHLGLDVLSNQKILKAIYSTCILRAKQSLLFFLTYKLLLLKLGPDAYNKTEHMDQFSSD